MAVIGSGIAGLSAAWLLSNSKAAGSSSSKRYEVDIYETMSALGLGAHAVDVDISNKPFVIDIPPRVFVDKFYTELVQLYRIIGVDFYVSNAATSYQVLSQQSHLKFKNLIVGGFSLPMAFGKKVFTLSFWRMLLDLVRFKEQTRRLYVSGSFGNQTLKEFAALHNYSHAFVEEFLVPMFAVICTCSNETVRNYPVAVIAEFLLCIALEGKGVKRAIQSTREIVALLTKNVDQVFLCCNR